MHRLAAPDRAWQLSPFQSFQAGGLAGARRSSNVLIASRF